MNIYWLSLSNKFVVFIPTLYDISKWSLNISTKSMAFVIFKLTFIYISFCIYHSSKAIKQSIIPLTFLDFTNALWIRVKNHSSNPTLLTIIIDLSKIISNLHNFKSRMHLKIAICKMFIKWKCSNVFPGVSHLLRYTLGFWFKYFF